MQIVKAIHTTFQKVIKLAHIEVQNLWVHFKDGVLKACVGRKGGGDVKQILAVGIKW